MIMREIIYEYWASQLPDVKKRDFDISLIKEDLINDIVGIRRAGKTYLMFYIINHLLSSGVNKKSTIYINLENRKIHPLKEEYFNQIIEFIHSESILKKYKNVYLFLDEIQNLNDWERWIRSIYDEFKGKIKIFISGSNAKLLKRDYAGVLTGRHLTIYVYPLSFKEFLFFKGISVNFHTEREKSLIKKYLEEYIKFGGFPEILLSEKKEEILQQYFTDIVTRDVVFREKIHKDTSTMEDLGIYLINNISTLVSFRNLSNFFVSQGMKISIPTLQTYYRLYEEAFLFFTSKIFSYKIKDQMQHPQKIYCLDTGLINSLSFKFSKNSGRIYENIVGIELKRKGKNIYYWKDYQHREVDFVVKNGIDVSQLIQVSFNLREMNVKEREIKSLLKASEELKCNNLLIINENFEGEEKIKGKNILFLPLWKWLLQSKGNIHL